MPPRLARLAEEAAAEPFGAPITADRATIEEARDALAAVKARCRPASDENRVGILFALADVVGKPDVLRNGDARAQTIFWMAYHADLGHLPAAVLSRACAAWRRSGETWFPTPGQILRQVRADEAWRADAAAIKGLARLANASEPSPDAEAADAAAWAAVQAKLESLKGRWTGQDAAARELRAAQNAADIEWFKQPRPRQAWPQKGKPA